MKREICAICGSKDYHKLFEAKDYRYHLSEDKFCVVKCNNCELVYLNPILAKREIAKFYPMTYYWNENKLNKLFKAIFQNKKERIKNIFKYKKGTRILDVGFGDGEFLRFFKDRNWDVFGVDISSKAYELVNKKIGSNIFNGELKDCNFPNNYFDVITLNDVLEHLVNPNDELNEIFRILKNDGILFVSVPNIDSPQFKLHGAKYTGLDVPRHMYHYSPKTLKMMLQKHGFEITKMSIPLFEIVPLDMLPINLMQNILSPKSIKDALAIVLLIPPLFIARIVLSMLNGGEHIEILVKKSPDSLLMIK